MKNLLEQKQTAITNSLLLSFLFYLLLVSACILNYPLFLSASTVKGGEKIVITEPVQGNLYIGGGEIDINAPITGDLFVGGGDLSIMDTIYRDILALGGNINLENVCHEDVRIMGGNIEIQSDVFGDLIIGGGNIDIEEGVTITGDLIIAGGHVDFHGIVKGTTRIYAGSIDFNGIAEKEVEIKSDNIEINGSFLSDASIAVNDLTIGDNAKFSGPVNYYTKEGEISFEGTLYNGAEATYDASLENTFGELDSTNSRQGRFLFFLVRMLSSSVLITILVLLLHPFFEKIPPIIETNSLNSLGLGLLYIISVPVISIVAFASVIGIPLGLILLALYAITIALGKVLASIMGAYYINRIQSKWWSKWIIIGVAIGVWVALKVLTFVPVVGWVIAIVAAVLSYGGMFTAIKDKNKLARAYQETI